jgi:8-oxo-dGTP diphosphatase
MGWKRNEGLDASLPVVKAVSVAASMDGKWLLVQRAHMPSKGKYAFPGGRVEAGETLENAARRELAEETGLEAGELSALTAMTLPGDGCVYELTVFSASEVSGALAAGDDAAAAGFFSLEEIGQMPMSPSTLGVILRFDSVNDPKGGQD